MRRKKDFTDPSMTAVLMSSGREQTHLSPNRWSSHPSVPPSIPAVCGRCSSSSRIPKSAFDWRLLTVSADPDLTSDPPVQRHAVLADFRGSSPLRWRSAGILHQNQKASGGYLRSSHPRRVLQRRVCFCGRCAAFRCFFGARQRRGKWRGAAQCEPENERSCYLFANDSGFYAAEVRMTRRRFGSSAVAARCRVTCVEQSSLSLFGAGRRGEEPKRSALPGLSHPALSAPLGLFFWLSR